MSTIEQISKPISGELVEFNRRFRQALKSDVFLLNLITRYMLKTKGKQMRPVLVLLSARVFGEIGEKTYAAASLIELLHTASLVHDDVVDEADRRRGFLSIHKIWNTKTAVLFGDYLLAQGLLQSVDCGAYDLLRIVSVAVREMSEGELLQLEHSRKSYISREEYFDVIRKKTAALMAACVESGAQSADATTLQVEQMRNFGVLLGLIFQIKDDLLDYQPKGITGKAPGNDLKERKHTLPLIHTLEQLPPDERKRTLKIVNGNAAVSEKLKTVIPLMDAHESIAFCYGEMKRIENEAAAILDGMPQNAATAALREILNYAAKRKA
jgi:octaprenyl-diphosphate synthase